MAKITSNSKLNVEISFVIDESEARALDALSGYGADTFIKAFYEHLGKSYMERHEAGLRKFLTSIRDVINPGLHQLDKAREFLSPKYPVKVECEIDWNVDVKEEFYRTGKSVNNTGVRLTHISTGITVTCDDQKKNRAIAREMLVAELDKVKK